MKALVIGDVHGCYHTFKEMVQTHWDPSDTFLIQVGDLIQKGPFNGACLRYAMELEKEYPYQVFFLMGNHEWLFMREWKQRKNSPSIKPILQQIKFQQLDEQQVIDWLSRRPLHWQTPHVRISHAGWAKGLQKETALDASNSLLFNRQPLQRLPQLQGLPVEEQTVGCVKRQPLQRLPQLQVVGHVVQASGRPLFKTSENAWFIDTGAYLGRSLSALLLNHEGHVLQRVRVATSPFDLMND